MKYGFVLPRGDARDAAELAAIVRPTEFVVPLPPVQRPRVPIWVVGGWPAPKSGAGDAPGELTPGLVREGMAWIRQQRAAEGLPESGYDVIVEGTTPEGDPAAGRETVRRWADAGGDLVDRGELDGFRGRRPGVRGAPAGRRSAQVNRVRHDRQKYRQE